MKIDRVYFRYVYNRKKRLNKFGKALLQQEVRIEKDKKYYSTGIYLKPNQWNGEEVVNHPRHNALNIKLRERLADVIKLNPQAFEQIEAHFKGKDPESFLEYFEKYIESHQGTYSTYKQYRSAYNHLQRSGIIKSFSDLTIENIHKLSDYLRNEKENPKDKNRPFKELSEQTVYNLHKRFKPAVRLAVATGRLNKNPYDSIRMSPGKETVIRYLTTEELKKLEDWIPTSDKLSRVKDLFLFSCYTGLSYSDIENFKVITENGDKWIIDQRKKTGEGFKVFLTKNALAILDRFPEVPTNQVVNRHLKEIDYRSGLDKEITFHCARHTFAVYMLNEKKAPLKVVAEILGHASVKTTEKYAKVLKESIREYMKD